MTKIHFLPFAFAALVLASASFHPSRASTPPPVFPTAAAEPATVHVSGDTLYYFGNFSQPSTAAFKAASGEIPRGQVRRMVISSVGGVTTEAREVALWVHALAWVVEVEGICFSSCANYIFPAAKARIIRKDAVVGWHGNERGMAVETAQKSSNMREELRKTLSAEWLEKPYDVVEGNGDQWVESATASALG